MVKRILRREHKGKAKRIFRREHKENENLEKRA